MSNQRDIQSKLAVLDDLTGIVCTFGAAFDLLSTAIDTKGFAGVMFELQTSRAINSSDVIAYSFKDSTDNSTFVDVEAAGSLPTRKQTANTIVIAAGGYLQTVGVFGTSRYVKLHLVGQADTSDVTITARPVLLSELVEFTGYDPATVPSDGLP